MIDVILWNDLGNSFKINSYAIFLPHGKYQFLNPIKLFYKLIVRDDNAIKL